MLVFRCCDRYCPGDCFALVDFSCRFPRIAAYLRHRDEVSGGPAEVLEVTHTKTVVDGNICISQQQTTLVRGKGPYTCELHMITRVFLPF